MVEESEEETLSPLEALRVKQRKEKKDLQGRIQGLKKSATKGDKKKKKEIQEEISKLESEIEERHRIEFDGLSLRDESPASKVVVSSTTQEESKEPDIRLTKAQKRRKQKEIKAKERENEIELEEEERRFGPRQKELDSINGVLSSRGLKLKEVPPDGDCLFAAIAHQLPDESIKSLRKAAASRLRQTYHEVLPFLTNEDGEPMTAHDFEKYCSGIETESSSWGGQLELNALSNVLKKKIEVIQATGTPVISGSSFEDKIILTYHRHMYGLGEHYNSVIKA